MRASLGVVSSWARKSESLASFSFGRMIPIASAIDAGRTLNISDAPLSGGGHDDGSAAEVLPDNGVASGLLETKSCFGQCHFLNGEEYISVGLGRSGSEQRILSQPRK